MREVKREGSRKGWRGGGRKEVEGKVHIVYIHVYSAGCI